MARDSLMVRLWRVFNKYGGEPPYYYKYSLWVIIIKPIRKWLSAVFIPTIPFNNLRVQCIAGADIKSGKVPLSECDATLTTCVTIL